AQRRTPPAPPLTPPHPPFILSVPAIFLSPPPATPPPGLFSLSLPVALPICLAGRVAGRSRVGPAGRVAGRSRVGLAGRVAGRSRVGPAGRVADRSRPAGGPRPIQKTRRSPGLRPRRRQAARPVAAHPGSDQPASVARAAVFPSWAARLRSEVADPGSSSCSVVPSVWCAHLCMNSPVRLVPLAGCSPPPQPHPGIADLVGSPSPPFPPQHHRTMVPDETEARFAVGGEREWPQTDNPASDGRVEADGGAMMRHLPPIRGRR